MKQIKDPVHGYINVEDEYFTKIIDTRPFQRLRDLKQLSATYMVYPSANHTRFEHSLGVYWLAKRAFEDIADEDFRADIETSEIRKTLLSAALLHDIGHPPFSHIAEKLLNKGELKDRLNKLGLKKKIDEAGIGSAISNKHPLDEKGEHELLSCIIVLEYYESALKDLGVNPYEVAAYILGHSLKAEVNDQWQHQIAANVLSSTMDVDRLDYVSRDNYMTGADVANLDVERLVSSYRACKDPEDDTYKLTFSEKALSTVSNYLDGRLAVYMWVTQHHKSVFANALLRELLNELDKYENGSVFTSDKITEEYIGDSYVRAQLRQTRKDVDDGSRLADLYDRFVNRDMLGSCWKHKLAYLNELSIDAREHFEEQSSNNTDQLEVRIADQIGIDEDLVWVEESYVPNYRPADLRDVQIAYQGEVKDVSDIGLYEEDDYTGPTPYIFAPKDRLREIVNLLNKAAE